MEHEKLSKDSRLPPDFFTKLKPNPKPYISSTYQMDKKRTTELLLFMQKAIANNLIVAAPCRSTAAAFMIPKANPNKPYRRKHKLSPLYKGPFRITDRNQRSMRLDINGAMKRISYLYPYPIHFTPTNTTESTTQVCFRNKRKKLYLYRDRFASCGRS